MLKNATRECDGIICFGGEDWWYHNRGHYDMQMMREFSKIMPVLYVCSIGMRTPSVKEGKVFVFRLLRKLRSFGRGFKEIRPNFGVCSLLTLPFLGSYGIYSRTLSACVKHYAKKMGILKPIIWVACVPAIRIADFLEYSLLVYQRTDRYEYFEGVNRNLIAKLDIMSKAKADLTIFCSALLFEKEGPLCKKAIYVDHGVDYEYFSRAAKENLVPEDVRNIASPRIGFVGGIDIHTFDKKLFVDVAKKMSNCSFILVGSSSLKDGWCSLENVHFLGKKSYEEVAYYMACCDVLIMPWKNNEWIEGCNPIKLKEYMAVGKPIVTTDFFELSRYQGFVSVARNAEDFRDAIADSLAGVPKRRQYQFGDCSWENKMRHVRKSLEEMGWKCNAVEKA